MSIPAIKSRLAELSPILKEAVVQTQTGLDFLSSTKPEDQEAIRLTMNHLTQRVSGRVERCDEDAYKTAEMIHDALQAISKLDDEWSLDEGRIKIIKDGIFLALDKKAMVDFVNDAVTVRSRLFTICLAIGKDPTGLVSKEMICILLKGIAALASQYCELLISKLDDLPF